jgi:PBP1b-binding outer membrane lipoprotein LpoB
MKAVALIIILALAGCSASDYDNSYSDASQTPHQMICTTWGSITACQ